MQIVKSNETTPVYKIWRAYIHQTLANGDLPMDRNKFNFDLDKTYGTSMVDGLLVVHGVTLNEEQQ